MMIFTTFFIVLILDLYGLIVNVDAIGLSDSSQIEYGFLQSVNIFQGSGNYVNVIVPSNITKIRVYMWGASGGCYYGNFGGSGAYVEGILSVLPEQQLQVLVGYGKFGGGGEGNCGSSDDGNCEGGGRSAIVSDSDDLVTAGGGGGAGSSSLGGPATSYLAGSKEAVGYQAILNITTAQIANMTTACLKLSDSQILGGGGGLAGGCSNGKRFSGGSAVSFNRTAGGGGGGGYYGGGGGSNGAGGGGSSYMEKIQDIQNSESGGFPIFDENSGWIPRCSGQNSPYFDGEKCNMKSCSIEGRSGKIVITIDEQISESPTLAPVYFPTNLPSQISTVTPTLTPSETPTTASPTTLEPSYSPTILLTLSPNIESVERIYSNYSCLNLSSLGNVEYTGSSSSGESHFPSEAFDDTISTYWQSNLTDFPVWIRVTLPKAVGLDAYRVASISTIPQLGGQEIINWEFQGYDEVDDVWITLDKRQDIKPNYSINQYEIHRTLTNHSYLPNPLFASYRVIVYDNNGWKDDEQHQFKVLVNEIKLCQKKLHVVPDDNLLEKSKRTKEALLRLSLFIIVMMVVAGGWIYFRGGSNAQNSSTTSGNTKRRVDGAVYSAVHRERSDEPDEEESLNPKYIIGDDEDNDEDDLRTIELAKR